MSWVHADVVELVAFALHVQIPIFLNMTDEPGDSQTHLEHKGLDLPPVFENVLTEIMSADAEPLSASTEEEEPAPEQEFQLGPDSMNE